MSQDATTPVPTFVGRASPAFRRLTLGVFGLVLASTLALTLTATTTEDRVGGLASLVVGALVLTTVLGTFASIVLEVGPSEVVVRYGRSPFRSRILLAQVQEVDTTDVGFWAWGGFGYRGSRRFFRKAAIVVRSGPAVRMHLDDGTWLAVTVDDAPGAAMAIRRARGG